MADDGTPESQEAFGQTPPDPQTDPTGPDALAEALRRVAEARETIVHLAAAEIDRFKLRFRRLAIWAIVGIVALVILLAILATATALLIWGLASLMVSLLGWPMWAGALAIGGGVLLIAVLALVLDLWAWNREAFKSARQRYENRKQVERNKFGRSIDPADDRSAQRTNDHPPI
jgi:membrane protein implicated in regulation of membrane protease activity